MGEILFSEKKRPLSSAKENVSATVKLLRLHWKRAEGKTIVDNWLAGFRPADRRRGCKQCSRSPRRLFGAPKAPSPTSQATRSDFQTLTSRKWAPFGPR